MLCYNKWRLRVRVCCWYVGILKFLFLQMLHLCQIVPVWRPVLPVDQLFHFLGFHNAMESTVILCFFPCRFHIVCSQDLVVFYFDMLLRLTVRLLNHFSSLDIHISKMNGFVVVMRAPAGPTCLTSALQVCLRQAPPTQLVYPSECSVCYRLGLGAHVLYGAQAPKAMYCGPPLVQMYLGSLDTRRQGRT